jgi:glycerol-3-phosphate acyltransferase PlsY
MKLYVIAATVAYLMGSIPFGFILARVFLGTDVRTIGSGNIGATNVMRTGSKGLGVATLLLDAAKGYVAVYIALAMCSGTAADLSRYVVGGVAAVCAMLGHIFPVWLKFKGGKGVATGVGVFLALAPKAVAAVLIVFLLIVLVFRYVSLASIVATALFPIAAVLLEGDGYVLLPFVIVAAILIIAKHHANIRRLLRGTEHRLELTKQ